MNTYKETDNTNYGNIEPDKLESFARFQDLVEFSQSCWRSLKRNPLRTFSQAFDLDDLSQDVYVFVFDNFTEYIPQDVKDMVRKTHPAPILAAGLLYDNRAHKDQSLIEVIYDENLGNLTDDQFWTRQDGKNLLTEAAIDYLTAGIFKTYINKTTNKHTDTFLKAGAKLTLRNRHVPLSVNRCYKILGEYCGGQDEAERLMQSLVMQMFTNEPESNTQLRKIGFKDFDEFAIKIGEQENYRGEIVNTVSSITSKNEEIDRWLWSFISGGRYQASFPGIVNILLLPEVFTVATDTMCVSDLLRLPESINKSPNDGLKNAVITSGLAVVAGFLTYKYIATVPDLMLHESAHYLTQNKNNFGLVKIKHEYKNSDLIPVFK